MAFLKSHRKGTITQLMGLGYMSEQNQQQGCPEADVPLGKKNVIPARHSGLFNLKPELVKVL